MKLPKLKDLMYGNLDVKIVNRDWNDLCKNDIDDYQIYEAEKCYDCGEVLVLNGCGEERHCDINDESNCEGYIGSEGPVMNYSYSLFLFKITPEEAAERIINLPLCIIEFSEEQNYFLALTGGGMDMTWEICEAYIMLGSLPPTHFCDLPTVSERGKSKLDKLIIAACKKSLRSKSETFLDTVKSLSKEYKEKYHD